MGRLPTILGLLLLTILAAGSLGWGVEKGLVDGADLERRAKEEALFARRIDPYQLADMTYPPSASPVFLAMIAPFRGPMLRPAWLVGNLIALAVFCGAMISRWGEGWPGWAKAAFCLVAAASKPTRAGMALGQFHLWPLALLMLALAIRRPGPGKHRWMAGCLVGVALIKPTMLAPMVLVLAYWRCWRELGIIVGIQAALGFGASAWVRVAPWTLAREWLKNASDQLVQGTIDMPTLVAKYGPSAAWDGSKISLGMLVLSAAILWALRRKSSLGLASLACFLAAIVTYHRPYDLVLLLPSLAYFLDRAMRGSGMWAKVVTVGLGFLLICPSPRPSAALLLQAYDLGFLVGCYAILLALTLCLWREPAAVPRSDGPTDQENRDGCRSSPTAVASGR